MLEKKIMKQIFEALKNGFCGIKPYQNNSPSYIPAAEVRIFDFLTPRQLEFMDKIHGTVILHIPRNLQTIGSEGFGMSESVKRSCDFIARTPMNGKINSLNASVAAGIVIHEVVRQNNIKKMYKL